MAEYIERESVIDIIRAAGFWEKEDMEVAIACVEYVPPADVAPVIHGVWLAGELDFCNCSECGNEVPEHSISPYCDECGAKMDEEEG